MAREKFSLYHNTNVPHRSRAETYMVKYIESYIKNISMDDIEYMRNHIVDILHDSDIGGSGSVRIGDIFISSAIAGNKNIYQRSFELFGRGRGTPTLTVSEVLFKNINNNYEIDADCVFNKEWYKNNAEDRSCVQINNKIT